MIDQLTVVKPNETVVIERLRTEVKEDFWHCCVSREVSLMGRKEVLTGKAKFGIFGDGKELPQVVMARMFKKGDWRSGYYRDQTFMFASGLCSVEEFFAQLYADTENDPFSKGRQMNAHFSTPFIDKGGNWLSLKDKHNVSSDISCTAGQIPRAVGIAQASKVYRSNPVLASSTPFSNDGNEVCFCTIGDASTSEGIFFEAINAAGVMQIPLAISVWDDGYGISVPKKYQTTKESISTVLSGFQTNDDGKGIMIYNVEGWNYMKLRRVYGEGIRLAREKHTPVLFHIEELTQPQGHSTSGSHERYKSDKRLAWEKEYDCIAQFEKWIIQEGLMTEEETKAMRKRAKQMVKEAKNKAWKAFNQQLKPMETELNAIFNSIIGEAKASDKKRLQKIQRSLKTLLDPLNAEIVQLARQMYFASLQYNSTPVEQLKNWLQRTYRKADQAYHTDLYSNSARAAVNIEEIKPVYSKNSPTKNGFEILNTFFDKAFTRDQRLVAFGEDVGNIGDVNQGFAGLQAKHGEHRIFDTGIREWSIMGQAVGLAMRGLRPIAEIQYVDYLFYGIEPLMDDLASLRYRSGGTQQAPAIIRTRGHRLEGVWHSGSPMAAILNALRGMCVLVPRNMVQAAGFYNTMVQADDPAIIIEVLNGYRQKEQLPDNLGDYTVPVGRPEVLQSGSDVTLVTYGACIRIAEKAMELLATHGISVELIDVQSLLPFDIEHDIVKSIAKTNRVVFLDEDVPGGATAFMMQKVLEEQGGYNYLDSKPVTVTAKEHRPPYGSNGDYFSKPNPEDVFQAIYQLLAEAEPDRFDARLLIF